MKNRKYAWAAAACFMATAPLVSTTTAAAEDAELSKDIVCAVQDVVGCTGEGSCIQGRAKTFDLPTFMVLDAENKHIRAAYESGNKAVSPVKNIERSGDHLFLQGVENSRGWDIAIDTKTGKMSASAVGEAISFLAFGSCTLL